MSGYQCPHCGQMVLVGDGSPDHDCPGSRKENNDTLRRFGFIQDEPEYPTLQERYDELKALEAATAAANAGFVRGKEKLLRQRDRLAQAAQALCDAAATYMRSVQGELEAMDVEQCNWPRHEQLAYEMDKVEAAIKECEE